MNEADTNNLAWAIDSALQESEKRTRRERIATAVLGAVFDGRKVGEGANSCAADAVRLADALIFALDKP